MFVKTFVILLLITIATTEIPSYIHVCGRRNPKIDECLINSLYGIRDKLIEGIPEFNISSIKSVTLNDILISDQPNNKMKIEKIIIYGLEDYLIKNLKFDLKNQLIRIEFLYKILRIDMDINMTTKFIIPIVGKYNVIGELDCNAEIIFSYKVTEKDDKKLFYFDTVKPTLHVKDLNIIVNPLIKHNNTVFDVAINSVLNSSKYDILHLMLPSYEKYLGTFIVKVSNNIVKCYEYDEILPDRE
ncbi:hypothetical protein M0802_005130 [Mischocyttarus mexicanus]|nr:hypothetical protein M0802_005130 [Mischocyttarus mexicanus]